jgi:hypothetical protein
MCWNVTIYLLFFVLYFHTGEMMLDVEKNLRAAPSHVRTQGPVDLKWACYIWRIFCPASFRVLIHFVSRIFCVIEIITYVRQETFLSGLKLTNLGDFLGAPIMYQNHARCNLTFLNWSLRKLE